jgi:sec-independent protein translocase protein TatC
MPLVDHLRELRSRLLKSIAAVAAGAVVGWVYYEPLFRFLVRPFQDQLRKDGRNVDLAIFGVIEPFTFQLKVAALAGVVLASPVWLYQLWSFVLPGLYARERRYTYLFMGSALPLFVAGMWGAYVLLPKSFGILLEFTPPDVNNLIPLDQYLSFMIRFLLVFGFAFTLPVFVVVLNLVGVVSSQRLRSWWRPIVFLIFVFTAAATPTPDPFSMLVLAIPMIVLFGVAVLITTLVDRRRRRASGEPDYDDLDDDEMSPLDDRPSPLDEHPSPIDDDPSPLDDEPSPLHERRSRLDDVP